MQLINCAYACDDYAKDIPTMALAPRDIYVWCTHAKPISPALSVLYMVLVPSEDVGYLLGSLLVVSS